VVNPPGAVVTGAAGLTKAYLRGHEYVQALRGTDLSVRTGELVGISGASGSGKSTLLAVLCGWETPDSGLVEHVAGPVAGLPWSALALVPQTLGLLEDLTVIENVLLGARLARPPRRERDRAETLLAELGLSHLAQRFPKQTSVGEQQRTAIARALLLRPALLLADEPTAHQDRGWGQAVLDALRRLADEGGAVLIVSHDETTLAFCDRHLTMTDGVLRAD
jgi:putative ABC transport system ATP-binding protein